MLERATNIDQGYHWKEWAMGYAWVPQRPVSNEWDDTRTTQSYHRTLSRRRRLREQLYRYCICRLLVSVLRFTLNHRPCAPTQPHAIFFPSYKSE
ncbi:hypothetical protein EVAR_41035_1 [Eumeta japonica]|uniref:Uncharacterized protein n=1 Tax=Eumeta variegata TaxID=151549 RepID=A0A4C1Z2E9_EUMVA|nr:hypothetical protein EVAR_41035_1 [Eumeta japonica]